VRQDTKVRCFICFPFSFFVSFESLFLQIECRQKGEQRNIYFFFKLLYTIKVAGSLCAP
jgi:hypothetical protein